MGATQQPRGQVVGALACQRDSYLRTLETEVLSCVEAPKVNGASSGKKAKKGAAAVAVSGEAEGKGEGHGEGKTWLIEFRDSVLFPEGGGQPTDHGTITPVNDSSSPSAAIPITHLERSGLRCIVHSPSPLSPGTPVRQSVDYSRRWDHMQQHTGQHLLSAIMDTYDNLETLGWGMGSSSSSEAGGGGMNYVDLPRKPSPQETAEIQRRCNEIIAQALPITVETPADATFERVPENYDTTEGVIRIIKIGELDANPCCGTHLQSTAHVGLVLLHHTQPVKGTNTRLYFSCGERAINLATSCISSLRSVGATLSVGQKPEEVVHAVERMSENVGQLKRREKKLLGEIAAFSAAGVKDRIREGKDAFVYRADGGMDFLTMVLGELRGVEFGGRVVVLAAGEGKEGGPVVVTGGKEGVEEMAKRVKEVLPEIKGGGKGEKWQGKVREWGKGEVERLRVAVEGAGSDAS